MAAQLKFTEDGSKREDRCAKCLFCLQSNIVDSNMDNGHEDCALEQTENGFPDELNCWTLGANGEPEKYGYWTI